MNEQPENMKERLEEFAASFVGGKPHAFSNLKPALAAARKKMGKPRVRVCQKCGCVEFTDTNTLNKVYQLGNEFHPKSPDCVPPPPVSKDTSVNS